MATTAKMAKVAEDYGYQLAFLKSDKELWSIFQKAVNGGWAPTRFVTAVRATRWYKTHNETWRNTQQLKYTDPKTWQSNLDDTYATMKRMAGEIGLSISGGDLARLANTAMSMGWSQDVIRNQLAMRSGKQTGSGTAGQVENALRETAYRNGINITDNYINNWIKNISMGLSTVEDAQQALREKYGAYVAPGFAAELKAGQDLYDLASPYMQTMAKTLELSPGDVDLFDPTIKKALASSNDKDGQVGSVPLWQFERDLKKDPRWLKTNGARGELDKTARSLGQMFGLGV